MPGHKHDSDKPRLDLILPGFLWEFAHVLTHGANKYGAYNWQQVEAPRYQAALMRHVLQYQSGELFDPETDLHHMAHVACSAMFLHYFDYGSALPARACQCSHCQPTNVHGETQ